MSFDSEAVSSAVATGGNQARQPASCCKLLELKLGLILVTLASLYAGMFLQYLWWDLSEWLTDLTLLCLLAILVFSLNALFRRRWKEFAIFSATLVVAFLPGFGVTRPVDWLYAEGFRIHASPLEDYLSGCRLIEFIEKGTRQTVGMCESHGLYSGYAHTVIYDTAGELVRPVSHRTQDWQRAMSAFFSEQVLNSPEARTRHIFGDFYEVGSSLSEERG
jgi:hypothetical protein